MSDTALKHVEYLTNTIGPRGSTTLKEKEGQEYVQKVLAELGCATRTETFLSSTSTYLPFVLGLGLVLIAEAVYWFVGRTPNAGVGALAAALISALMLASLVLELWAADNPLRWLLPVAPSQNVVGVAPASGEVKRRIVVMAHVDIHRTPMIWQSPNHFKAYRVLSTLGVLSLVALVVVFVVSTFAPSEVLRNATLVPVALVAIAFAMVVQAHNTPFAVGANDNASGVGVMLSLAEQLAREPLKNTEVWWVASGCEEVGAYGSADFVHRHAAKLGDGVIIVVDNIAGQDTGPVYLTSETLLLPLKYPDELVKVADSVSAENPDLKGWSTAQQGAYTDGVHALKAGLKCLTFVGYTRDNWIPNWHNVSDIFANVDADAVDRTERFVLAVIRKLDAQG